MTIVKSIVTAAATALITAGAAHAADLPARVAPAPYVAPVPVFTWTGAYFGINGGYGFDDAARYRLAGVTSSDNGIGTTRPSSFRNSDDGFTAGGQLGYNYQLGAAGFGAAGNGFGLGGIVVGFETDAAYVDAAKSGTFTATNTAGTLKANNTFRSGIDFLGTVRGRIGLTFNQFLVYGTGGFAYGDVFDKAALYAAGNANQLRYYGSKSGFETGYTYGGGVEFALPTGSFLNFFKSSAVTVKAEYLRYDLGSSTFLATNRISTTPNSAYSARVENEGNLARVGLNYKF